MKVEDRRGEVLKSLPNHEIYKWLRVCDSLLAFSNYPQIRLTAPSLKILSKRPPSRELLNGVTESNLRAITELIHIISKS